LTVDNWKPIPGDNSFTDVPWMPSPTSPPDNTNTNVLQGYGRPPSPGDYGQAVLRRGGDYKDYLLDDELSSDEARIQLIQNSIANSGGRR
jgi:hypothetical protein